MVKPRSHLTDALTREAPIAPARTAWHDAAERNGCPLDRCIAAAPGDCHAIMRVHGICLAQRMAAEDAP